MMGWSTETACSIRRHRGLQSRETPPEVLRVPQMHHAASVASSLAYQRP